MASNELAIVALGSNLGDSQAILEQALDHLQAWSAVPLLKSSIWKTAPVDCPPGSPPFLNAVCALIPFPHESPETLLKKLLGLEQNFGPRPRRFPNEPRLLDLDLILFGEQIRSSPDLTLPHPRAVQRRFVLGPLVEIAPDLVFPGRHRTVGELLKEIKNGG
jgi:2-amino-4-hydroxy-6-hydroxymethyldihydropteridine diphosphokinase